MDAGRPDEAMTGDAIDRELRGVLAVNPSPGFAARVRQQIAADPPRTWSWQAWRLAAAAACVAAAAAAAVVVSQPRSPATPKALASHAPPVASSTFAAPQGRRYASHGLKSESAADVRPIDARRAGIREARTGQASEPEILIDPREAAALRALIAGARDARVDLAPLLQAAEPRVMELLPLDAIEIPPITIKPLAPEASDQGARQ